MNDAREAMLNRLRDAAPSQARQTVPPPFAQAADGDATLIDRFAAALERIGVTWGDRHRSERPIVSGYCCKPTPSPAQLTWDAAQLPAPGLLDTMNVPGIETISPDLRRAAANASAGS